MVKGTPHPSVRLERKTPKTLPQEEQPSKKKVIQKKKRKRQRRRRQRKRSEPKRRLLLLHSIVGTYEPQNFWMVTRWWAGRQGRFSPSSGLLKTPGARVKRIVLEVAKLDMNRDSSLLLTVGGNDLFFNNGKCGSSEGLVGQPSQRQTALWYIV